LKYQALIKKQIDPALDFTYSFYKYKESVITRIAVKDNYRMNLRINPEQKAMLVRAAALTDTDLTDFVVKNAVREAEVVIKQAEQVLLSARDSLRVLAFLEYPPKPNIKLLRAAKALPSFSK
jgi:uncharacterized protein (DUF1778 family)